MTEVLNMAYTAHKPKEIAREEGKQVEFVFGGLTWRAERMVAAALNNSGYRARILPNATRADLLKGREMADIGQCCPTAFTTGSLVNFLEKEVRDRGVANVEKEFAFVTAGSCGACRFGQYHQSYELALNNLGLEQFRLFLVQQSELDQSGMSDGFSPDAHLLLGTVTGIALADIIQDLEYQMRPYEVEPGATEKAVKLAIAEIADALESRPKTNSSAGAILYHLVSPRFTRALRRARRHFESVELDRLRPKPIVSITGEFYLATVEGEQNYNIHSWLEREGAEVYPSAVVTYLDYLLRFSRQFHEERDGIVTTAGRNAIYLSAAARILQSRYNGFRKILGSIPRPLPPQNEIRRLAAPFYDGRLNGGEGDLLIGKAIWAYENRKSHMICELSPYGCLPNTMSIGAMANVLGAYPDMLYAPLEIKGDSEVHALSRCQMILTEAKERAADEFSRALKTSGLTLDDARTLAAKRKEMRSPFWRVPKRGAVSTAANVVLELGNARL